MPAPWGLPFVGSHLLLTEPTPKDKNWNTWPTEWNAIRFDAMDVLFVSPFRINPNGYHIQFENVDGGNLLSRFQLVIRAARTMNPNIKIVLEQFYDGTNSSDFSLLQGDKIGVYAASIRAFMMSYHGQSLDKYPSGSGKVSAELNGWEADIEGSNLVDNLTDILLGVRHQLNALSSDIGKPVSVSIAPAWTKGFDSRIAQALDYVNMQNYDGGWDTFPTDYKEASSGTLQDSQLIWGICSERPRKNTPYGNTGGSRIDYTQFDNIKAKIKEIHDAKSGVYTWRTNSDNRDFENDFNVWVYNKIHDRTLHGSKTEDQVKTEWNYWVKQN